jgi:hypothetical protein
MAWVEYRSTARFCQRSKAANELMQTSCGGAQCSTIYNNDVGDMAHHALEIVAVASPHQPIQ